MTRCKINKYLNLKKMSFNCLLNVDNESVHLSLTGRLFQIVAVAVSQSLRPYVIVLWQLGVSDGKAPDLNGLDG